MKLFAIQRSHQKLVLIKCCAPFRSRLFWLQVVSCIAGMVLLGWVLASRIRPGYLLFSGLLLLVLLVLAARVKEIRFAAFRDEAFCFDKDRDAILKNGQAIASISDMDHVLVRQIVQETMGGDSIDYALVLSMADSRRIMVAESLGVVGGKAEIEQAAREIAGYAGVKVEEGTRRATEYWMDLS